MTDKTDIGSLLREIERICREHHAMKGLLREDRPDSWQNDVIAFYAGTAREKEIEGRFDALNASIRSSPTDILPVETLVEVLRQTNLENETWWPSLGEM